MRFKTLKHKTLPDTFGHIIEVSQELPSDQIYEIAHGSIPLLQPMTATMEMTIQYWGNQDQKKVIEDLSDYEMIEVEVNVALPGYEYEIIAKNSDKGFWEKQSDYIERS